MRKTTWRQILGAVAVVLVVASASAAEARPGGRDPHAELQHELQVLRAQVQQLQREAARQRLDRVALRRGLDDVAARLDGMERRLRTQRRPVAISPAPMEPASFATLRRMLGEQPFAGGKLATLSTAAAGNLFTASQARTLLDAFPHSGDRLRAAELLWPRVIDRENAFLLYGAFSHEHDRMRLQQLLARPVA